MAARDKNNLVRFSAKRSLAKIGLSESGFDNFLSGCRMAFSFGHVVVTSRDLKTPRSARFGGPLGISSLRRCKDRQRRTPRYQDSPKTCSPHPSA